MIGSHCASKRKVAAAAFFCGDGVEGNSGNTEPNKWNYVLKFH